MDSEHKNDFAWDDIYTGEASDYMPPNPLLLEIIDGLEPGRALDVGCGAGGLVVALIERGWQVTGVDVAPSAIKAARQVLAARGLEAELHVGDASAALPPGTYDLVTNSFALPDDAAKQARFYRLAQQALAPGGTLLLEDFDASMKRFQEFARFHCPSVEELRSAFDGMEIVRAEVVETPAHGHGEPADDGQGPWTAALLHARRV